MPIKRGSTELSDIKLGSTDVEKVMKGTVEVWSRTVGEDFAITSQPQSQSAVVGDPATDYTLSVSYRPAEATVQWQWCNDGEGGCTDFSDISGATGKDYVPVPSNGDDIVYGQNYDHFRAVVTLAGEDGAEDQVKESDAAVLSVGYGPSQTLDGDALLFLASRGLHYYSGAKPSGWNATMESLSPDLTFPDGQLMPICAHSIQTSYVASAAAAGFNQGYWQNSYNYSSTRPVMDAIGAQSGMAYVGYLRQTAQNFSEWNTKTQAALISGFVAEATSYWNDSAIKGKVAGFMMPLDDNTDDIVNNSSTRAKFNAVMQALKDFQPVPNGSFGIGGVITSNGYPNLATSATNLIQQDYVNGGSSCTPTPANYQGIGFWKSYKCYKLTGHHKHFVDADLESIIDKPRIVPLGDGPFCYHSYEDKTGLRYDADNQRLELIHNALLAMMTGCNAYWLYQFNDSYMGNCSTPTNYRTTAVSNLLDFFTRFTSNKVGEAFLWGVGSKPAEMAAGTSPYSFKDYVSDNPVPVNAVVTQGQSGKRGFKGAKWTGTTIGGNGSENYTDEMLEFRDLQLGRERFIVATNSLPRPEFVSAYGLEALTYNGVLEVEFRGLPNDGTESKLKVVDILTDDVYTISGGKVIVDIPPTGSVILKITPAEGWIVP